jgi:hypothetical protein
MSDILLQSAGLYEQEIRLFLMCEVLEKQQLLL